MDRNAPNNEYELETGPIDRSRSQASADPAEPVTGLVLVDHGSRFQAANDMLTDVVALFKSVSRYAIVEPAHMELAAPTIAQAVGACVRQGAQRVIVHPYFLSPGRHSTTDIPRMTGEAASHYPGLEWHVTQPLGIDERIARVISERIDHCVQAHFLCEACEHHAACATERRV